ncbi:MAG: TonB family protein [Gammaproteobacteria bacterium]|nr:TonB family protein [Gammaproteobacteria bacterium]
MTAVSYSNLALGWTPENKQDNYFNRLSIFVVFTAVIFGYVMSLVNVPKEERKARTVVPERVAKFILQKEKPKIIKIKPKPKPKQLAKVIKRVKKKTKIDKPLNKIQKKARKKAESSGLLALSNELSDLMDTSSINAMVGKRVKRSSAAFKMATVNKSVLTKNASKGSGGVSKDKYITSVSKTVLTQTEKVAFRQSLALNGSFKGKNHKTTRRGDNVRSEEDVIFVMDKNKSKLHSLYRRARRSHPGLKGKIVLEITIAPSGKVLKVRIKSSELNDPKLESRLVARIKRFDFGSYSVQKVTVTFPIEFLPS